MRNVRKFQKQISKAKEILEGKHNGSFLLRERDITENSNFRFEVAVILRIANGITQLEVSLLLKKILKE